MFKRIVIHIIGIILVALGIISVSIASVGAAPFDAFNWFLSELIPAKFFTFGVVTFLSNAVMALVLFVLTRKKSLIISIGLSLILGLFIDQWAKLILMLPVNVLSSLLFRIPLALFGVVMIGFSFSLLIVNQLPMTPYDAMTVYFKDLTGSMSTGKSIVDGSLLLGAIILGLITKKLFVQIHVFSIIAAFGVGPVIEFFLNIMVRNNFLGCLDINSQEE